MSSIRPGSLVRTRGRDWVVLPESSPEFLQLRPLAGTEADTTGVDPNIEQVVPAVYPLPTVEDLGDHLSARLLLDAAKLGIRSSAGPFRSFGDLGFEPRDYQLVPLLMALKQDELGQPVRLLIADDVGVGKTVEAGLIAKELLAQGSAARLAILCPPHLVDQWKNELDTKFHIDALPVTARTAPRLERGLRYGQSIFDVHPHVIVSTEFIKSDRRRPDFLRTCPELVIVDEAHQCARADNGARHQRHELIAGLTAGDTGERRHIVLVTATPHSGKDSAFRSLLGLLDPELEELPSDLSGDKNRRHRDRLARHLVQRRRNDILAMTEEVDAFPERRASERTYAVSPDHLKLLREAQRIGQRALNSQDLTEAERQGRTWAAIGLMRAIASSPAAAAATLRNRINNAAPPAEIVFDADTDGTADAELVDRTNSIDIDQTTTDLETLLAKVVRAADPKADGLIPLVQELLEEGYPPVVFCKFIETAEHVAAVLDTALPDTSVAAVTGNLDPTERERVVAETAAAPRRVLVATDCLSEGVNLQHLYGAVIHYDLAWAPTVHEQREGRVDRYGQPRDEVRIVTYYAANSAVDHHVVSVLVRKHQSIRSDLGIAIPLPINAEEMVGDLLTLDVGATAPGRQPKAQTLRLFEDPAAAGPTHSWGELVERARKSGALFSQAALSTDEAATQIALARGQLHTVRGPRDFLEAVVRSSGGSVVTDEVISRLDLRDVPAALREVFDTPGPVSVVDTEPDVTPGVLFATRTNPVVAGAARYVLETALRQSGRAVASRAAVAQVALPDTITETVVLLLLRFRYEVVEGRSQRQLLAEDVALVGVTGLAGGQPTVLPDAILPALVAAPAVGNLPEQRRARLFRRHVTDQVGLLTAFTEQLAHERSAELAEQHRRVRVDAALARERGTIERMAARWQVTPHLPVDVLGTYVLLPGGTPS